MLIKLEASNTLRNSLKYQFVIIASLIFVLPVLILLYILYQKGFAFDSRQLLVFAFILLLILSGLMILRYIFDSIFSAARLFKEATESGREITTDITKDVAELNDVYSSFNNLLKKFEQAQQIAARRAIELDAIKDISEIAIKNTDTEELLNNLLDRAFKVTHAQIGSLFAVDAKSGRLRLVGSRGITGLEKGAYINIKDSLIQHVVSEKKPLLVTDIENDPTVKKKNDPKYGSPSFLSMPICTGDSGEVTAVLNLSNKKTGEVFDANDENILSAMLVDVSFNMENAMLHAKVAEYIKYIEERNIKLEQEIDVRKQTEISLKTSEARFRELADLLPQTVFETNRNGSLLFVNRAAFKLFGYTRDDVDTGMNIINICIPQDKIRIFENMKRIMNGEDLGGIEYTAMKKDGISFPIVVFASPIIQENNPVGLRGIAVDMTEKKQAEETQRKLHEDLIQTEKLAALGMVAAGVAHEVKNPLAIIIQGVDYLKTSAPADPLLPDIVERISKSAQRADSIVKGLLSFTRQMPLEPTETEIETLIEETLSFAEEQIKSKNINITRHFSPGLPTIHIDSNQIRQVFTNILMNSLEAMPNGGTISISTDSIKSEAAQKNDLQIVFADTGCGIPADKIEKVFDPFYTTKDTSGNAGLGLSITKGIIDKHQGTIRIESEPGKGTRITIRLPSNEVGKSPA